MQVTAGDGAFLGSPQKLSGRFRKIFGQKHPVLTGTIMVMLVLQTGLNSALVLASSGCEINDY